MVKLCGAEVSQHKMDVTSKEWKSLFATHPFEISKEDWMKMCDINPFMKEYPKGHHKHGEWYDGYRKTPDLEAAERLLDLLKVYSENHKYVFFNMEHPLEYQSTAFLDAYNSESYPWTSSCLVPDGSETWDLDAYILKMLCAEPSTIQYIRVRDFPIEFQKKMADAVLRHTSDAFPVIHGLPWEIYLDDFDGNEDEMHNPLCYFQILLGDKEFVLNLDAEYYSEYYTLRAIIDHCPLLFDPDVCAAWLQDWENEDEFYLVADYLNKQKKCPPMDVGTCKYYLEELEQGSDDHEHAKQLLRERIASRLGTALAAPALVAPALVAPALVAPASA